MIWVFYGDSITHGAKHTYGWRDYPELFAERVCYEMQRGRDMVINSGESGNTTRHLLDDFDWRITQFNPDVVSVMIGLNDSSSGPENRDTFRANMNEIVSRVLAAGAALLLNTTNPKVFTEGDLPAYNDIIRGVAENHGVELVDHWTHWMTTKPDDATRANWMRDTCHPNEYGHRAFANLIFQHLGIYDPNSNTCRLIVP
jgi:lysophospholipase L1-like esterase